MRYRTDGGRAADRISCTHQQGEFLVEAQSLAQMIGDENRQSHLQDDEQQPFHTGRLQHLEIENQPVQDDGVFQQALFRKFRPFVQLGPVQEGILDIHKSNDVLDQYMPWSKNIHATCSSE